MSDATHIEIDETPVNPYSLLEAVNRSSDTAHMGWLIFLGIMAYLLVAVAGVTHRDLLLATPVPLPVLGVEIQQVQFFQFASVLIVLFHLGLVSQLVLLARKTLEFDNAVHQLEPSRKRSHPLRLELHNFFFVQGIAGPNRSKIMALFLHGMSWLTLVVIPVMLLLFIQISFVPYHSVGITWIHRIALLVDIGILALLGVFLTRAETNFFQALSRAVITHPVTTFGTLILFGGIMFVSFVIATIPGEGLDRSLRKYFERPDASVNQAASGQAAWNNPLAFLFGSADGSLFGLFHRNLIVTDSDLVVDRDVSKGEPSISLRNRDLRYARLDRSDLHQADMTGSNLDGATLTGANLIDVKLNCSDENELILTDDRKKARCSSARRANFDRARLRGATMNGIDLRFAELKEADLENATLKFAWLAGANFSSANLQKTDITGGAKAQGAVFLIANLEGADLTGAQLQYADFSSSFMQGITLEHAQLQGANLRDADIDSAYMRRVHLQGADMTGANLKGADLREATVWMTLPPKSDQLKLADLSALRVRPPTASTREEMMDMVQSIADPQLRRNVRDSLAKLLTLKQSAAWQTSNNAQIWQSLKTIERPGIVVDYSPELTAHLVKLACRSRWANGAVADGIARRALSSRFQGNMSVLYANLAKNTGCTGGQALDDKMKLSLQNAVETQTEAVQ
ncbi:MAG: pentapeptide repeat-containing protein [Hyphomicrobiaceae bacterium]